jgi:hypothetical protein
MRVAAVLGVVLSLTVVMAGCGKGPWSDPPAAGQSGEPLGNPVAAASGGAVSDALLMFTECMRQNGMPWFQDAPAPGREQNFDLPSGVKKEDFEAAQQACRQSAQGIAKLPLPNPAEVESLLRLAKCMRENGVPDYPDPGADGSLMLDGDKLSVKTKSETFKAAEKACEQYGQ